MFRELVGTRLLLASLASATFVGVVLVTVLVGTAAGAISFDRQTAILTTLILVITLQALAASFALAFSILSGREQSSFLPIRDYRYYLDTVQTLNDKR